MVSEFSLSDSGEDKLSKPLSIGSTCVGICSALVDPTLVLASSWNCQSLDAPTIKHGMEPVTPAGRAEWFGWVTRPTIADLAPQDHPSLCEHETTRSRTIMDVRSCNYLSYVPRSLHSPELGDILLADPPGSIHSILTAPIGASPFKLDSVLVDFSPGQVPLGNFESDVSIVGTWRQKNVMIETSSSETFANQGPNPNFGVWRGLTPNEIVHGYKAPVPLDLVPLPPSYKTSQFAQSFAQHIHDLHARIRATLTAQYDSYQAHANVHRRASHFKVGDLVLVRLVPERLPSGTVIKLASKRAGPFRVIKNISNNTLVWVLFAEWGISPIFNVSDLTLFVLPPHELSSLSFSSSTKYSIGLGSGSTDDLSLPVPTGSSSDGKSHAFIPSADMFPRFPKTFLVPDVILAVEPLTTSEGDTYRFLIRWRDRPPSDDSWVLAQELQRLDADLLRRYLSDHASEMLAFEWGRIDGEPTPPLLADDDPVAEALRHKDLRRHEDGNPRYNLRPRHVKAALK